MSANDLDLLESPQDLAAYLALCAENNKREKRLWGDLVPAKRILQRRGFGVWWHNRRKRQISVGGKIVSVAEFKRMAARHKRISGIT